jgi:hypothetical protein
MEMWEIALFWLTAGIAWGVACGVMDSRDICGVRAPGKPFRQILGGLLGYGIACLIFKNFDPEGGHTIVWLLEVVTVSQLVQNYVRNWLK